MLQSFKQFIEEEKLFTPKDLLIVAVSGGVDSMVLLHLLQHIQQPIVVAHCNFMLRGKDSEMDQALVLQYCQKQQLTCETISFDTKSLKENSGLSTQMLARQLRYDWFEKLRIQHQAAYVVTAHHQQDVFETLLINLTRGTGIKGLHGIRPSNPQWIRRPLLPFKKENCIQYAQENNIPWREDKSNASNQYLRNHIRNEILPILKQYNPAVEEAFYTTSNILFEYEQLAQNIAETMLPNYTRKEAQLFYISYKIRSFKNGLPILFQWIEPYGFNWEQAKMLYQKELKQSGSMLLSETHRLLYNRDEWIIHPLQQAVVSEIFQISNLPFTVATQQGDIIFEKSNMIAFVNRKVTPNEIYMDAQVLNTPLEITTWQAGDRIQPLGMQHSKKISDLLIDKKIDLYKKSTLLILKNYKEILWLIGIQSSEQFKITPKTAALIKITFNAK